MRRAVLAQLAGFVMLMAGCVGGTGTPAGSARPATENTLTMTVDSGPAAASGAINHGYVTVRVCARNSTSQCVSVDHVLVDTASWGLRLVSSVLSASGVTLAPEVDSAGHTIEECVTFGGGQTWGPVVTADVQLAGESVSALPVQLMDDTQSYANAPASCGANGTLINSVSGFNANGVLGIGVFAQDCGSSCVTASAPLPIYFGCTSGAGAGCTAENVSLAQQVTNPVSLMEADNNGVLINLPNLVNANGDVSVQGSLVFGLSTQTDNVLPSVGLTVLGTNAAGDFVAAFGASSALPAWIDSGSDAYEFDDPSLATCAGPAYVGYYCPANPPIALSAVNTGTGVNAGSGTVDFAITDPNSFVANAAAFAELGGGAGSSSFIWGMPFFYGRRIYIGLEQRTAGTFTGPYFAY